MKYNYEEEDADEDHTQRLLFRGRGVSLTGCNLNATTTVQFCTEMFFR